MTQLAQLAKRFPSSTIRQVPVGGGVKADYVPASVVVEKLLAVCGPFSWHVRGTPDGHVIGSLTVTIDGREVTVEGVGEGSDLKSAESDALKRAARMCGVGLHLWSQDLYRLDRALLDEGDA